MFCFWSLKGLWQAVKQEINRRRSALCIEAFPGRQLEEIRLEVAGIGGQEAEQRVLALPGGRQVVPLPLLPPIRPQQPTQRVLFHRFAYAQKCKFIKFSSFLINFYFKTYGIFFKLKICTLPINFLKRLLRLRSQRLQQSQRRQQMHRDANLVNIFAKLQSILQHRLENS